MPQIMRPTKPELDDDCFIFLSAFYDLSTCRAIGGEVIGDIPFTAILKWLEYYRVTREEADYYLEIIPRLDRLYLKHVYKKREESMAEANRGGPRKVGIGSKKVRR